MLTTIHFKAFLITFYSSILNSLRSVYKFKIYSTLANKFIAKVKICLNVQMGWGYTLPFDMMN